ncbi:MAG TPA: Eco57I restriction-modification methylase domain-containing protein, partial [Clostridia bacterium]|nr:Eco57I restriction-modification methylase domain-containing protein [Clostridia bacterium]
LINYYKQRYERSASKGSYDLYVVFIERSMELLQNNGQLAFIVPHSFFNTEYGEPIRSLLSEQKNVRHIVYFGQHQIFPKATNYVCLLFLAKAGANEFDYDRVDSFQAWLDTHAGTSGRFPSTELTAAEWNIAVGHDARFFERLKALPIKLGDVAAMFVGLQTSADTVFLFKGAEKSGKPITRVFSKELDREVQVESALLKPVVRSGQIGRYWAKPSALVLFPYKLVNGGHSLIPEKEFRDNYGKAWQYLCDNKGLLTAREHGKFAETGWYQLYPKNLDVWEQSKIMLPYMITELSAWYDDGGSYFVNVTTGGFGLTLSDDRFTAKFVTALLNSTLEDWFLKKVSRRFRGGYFGANKQFLVKLPLPDFTLEQRQLIESLVTFVLWLHTRKTAGGDSGETTGVPLIAAFMQQWVNALVYELFFPQELHSADLHFFDLIQALDMKPLESFAENERLPELQALFKATYASDHKLRQALYRLGSLDLVRTIEGKV